MDRCYESLNKLGYVLRCRHVLKVGVECKSSSLTVARIVLFRIRALGSEDCVRDPLCSHLIIENWPGQDLLHGRVHRWYAQKVYGYVIVIAHLNDLV